MIFKKKGNKGPANHEAKPKGPGFFTKLYNLLFHEDVYYRIGGYLVFGLVLFLVAWAIFQFALVRPNLLGDSFMVQKLFKVQIVNTLGTWGAKHFGETWQIFQWKINVADTFKIWGNVFLLTFTYFLNHLIFVIPFILFFNFFKVSRWNLGAIYFGFYTVLWGVVTGTQSLTFPYGANQVFGPLILFARFGLWTWFSYLLLMVSTTQFTWLSAPSWSAWSWNKERKFWPVSFTPDQREVFIYGLLFLLASSFAEARIFVHYNL